MSPYSVLICTVLILGRTPGVSFLPMVKAIHHAVPQLFCGPRAESYTLASRQKNY